MKYCKKCKHLHNDNEELCTACKKPLYEITDENTPVYITAPGHLGGGKDALVGIKDNPLVKEKIDFYGYDYALYLAHAGFVSIAFDPVGFGERREKVKEGDENILLSSCYEISHMAESLGLTLCGILVHEIVALIDMLSCWKRWG